MLLNNSSLSKRMGLAKCPACGTYYDPTTTNGPCPQCSRRYDIATWVFALIVLAFLFLLPVPSAEAQAPTPTETPSACWVEPDGSERCLAPAVTAQATPTATPAQVPPTATPIVIRPLHFLYLPVAAR